MRSACSRAQVRNATGSSSEALRLFSVTLCALRLDSLDGRRALSHGQRLVDGGHGEHNQ
jgi:hypothetical protein